MLPGPGRTERSPIVRPDFASVPKAMLSPKRRSLSLSETGANVPNANVRHTRLSRMTIPPSSQPSEPLRLPDVRLVQARNETATHARPANPAARPRTHAFTFTTAPGPVVSDVSSRKLSELRKTGFLGSWAETFRRAFSMANRRGKPSCGDEDRGRRRAGSPPRRHLAPPRPHRYISRPNRAAV